jgi:hypothetical protein
MKWGNIMEKPKKSLLKIVPECTSISKWEYQDDCTEYATQSENKIRCKHFAEGICTNKKLIAEELKKMENK